MSTPTERPALCRCGHARESHEGHTFVPGREPIPNHCACCLSCRRYDPITERPAVDLAAQLTCRFCAAPYGLDGWCDVVIPNEIWNSVFPDGGVVCFRCMTKRIVAAGLKDVPVNIASGPYKDANETWRLIGLEHGRAQLKEWEERYAIQREQVEALTLQVDVLTIETDTKQQYYKLLFDKYETLQAENQRLREERDADTARVNAKVQA